MKDNTILRVLVGSRAHGLSTPSSDYDWRGIFVTPTEEILKLGTRKQQTNWIEGKEDDTSWEIGHFLNLATHCNPTILEVFAAPGWNMSFVGGDRVPYPKEVTRRYYFGLKLQGLFPYVWNSKGVMDAFVGYGLNQRKKFLDDKDVRPAKYAVAYLRTLYQADALFKSGTLVVDMRQSPIYETLVRWKQGHWDYGEVIQLTREWEKKVRTTYDLYPKHTADLDKVNEFLLKVRREFWDGSKDKEVAEC